MRKFLLALIILFAPVLAHAVACPTGYSNIYQIQIPAKSTLSADVTNYPMPFTGHTELATTGNGGTSLSSGTDVVFCDAASSGNLLSYEQVVGSYSATSGAGVWWVRVPTVSKTTTQTIYAFVGKSSDTDHSCGPSGSNNCGSTLWSGYLQVHHFGTSSTLTLTDSTGNCTSTNHSATATAGPNGFGAANFVAASSQYIDTGCTSNATSSLITVKALVNPTSFISAQRIVSNLSASNFNGYDLTMGFTCPALAVAANGQAEFNSGNGTGNLSQICTSTAVSTAAWRLFAVTQNGSSAGNLKLYVDGASVGTQPNAAYAITNSASNVNIGRWSGGASNYFDGKVAEVQIYAGAQTADVLTADNLSWNSPGTFVSFSVLTVATPTFSPSSGAPPQTVTISDSTAGAALVYCTDTTNTCTPSTSYATPVSVTTTPTSYLRAKATLSGYSDSAVASATYLGPATYYVSAAGSDSNNGTSTSTPWQTIAKVNAHTFVAGDVVYFRGGDTFSGTLTLSLVGTQASPITIASYGTGNATISSGTGDGIDLTDSEFYTITGLTITGSGWTGTEPSITVLNGGSGIRSLVTRTSGLPLRSSNVANNTISGYWFGVLFDSRTSASLVGFQGINISYNTLSNNLTGGVLIQGYGADAGGPVAQITNVYAGHNTVINVPGDPNSGTGGVHGSIKTEAWGINIGSSTGVIAERNYIQHVAGYGGYSSGIGLGGSSSLSATNSRNVQFLGNEIGYTGCVTHFDGSGMDLDQDVQNAEVAYNLTYNNVGESVEMGSFGGKTTQNIRVHHNISYNDARGIDSTSENGALNMWGSTDSVWWFNNTVYVDGTGSVGQPSAVNFSLSTNTHITFANNLFKTTNGVPFVYSNRAYNIGHIGTSQVFTGNVYDSSGGSLWISNDNGTASVSVTSLAQWQTLGFESLNGQVYGSTGAANLSNLAGFTIPSGGFLANGGLEKIHNFDITAGSSAIAAGVDPELVGTFLGWTDWHNSPARTGLPVDVGASAYLQQFSGGGPGPIVVQ